MCTIASLNLYWKWCDTEQISAYILSAMAISIAILVKPNSAYLVAPMFVFTYQKYGWRFFSQWPIWLYGALAVVPAYFWYKHAYVLWLENGNTLFRVYTDLNYSALWSSKRNISLFLHNTSYMSFLSWRMFYLWASVGCIVPLFQGGISLIKNRNWVIISWALSFFLTMIVFAEQNFGHDYYQWPLAMLATIVAAHGAMELWRLRSYHPRAISIALVFSFLSAALFWSWLRGAPDQYQSAFGKSWILDAYFCAGILLMLGFAIADHKLWRPLIVAGVVVSVTFGCWTFVNLAKPYPFAASRQAFAHRLATLTRPDDKIVIAQIVGRKGWYQHKTDRGEFLGYMPIDFYLSHRRGWSVEDVKPGFIDELRMRGARYFAAFSYEVPIIEKFPDLIPYLARTYKPLAITDHYVIYELSDPRCTTDENGETPPTLAGGDKENVAEDRHRTGCSPQA